MAFWYESSGKGQKRLSDNEPDAKRIKSTDDNDWSDVSIPDYKHPVLSGELAPIPPSQWIRFARNDTPNIPGELTMHGPDTHPTIIATTKPQTNEPQVRQSDDYLLKLYGFKIDWKHSLGSGLWSMGVYLGTFGRNINKNKDINGQYLRGVEPGDKFAAKYVLIKTSEDIDDFQLETVVIKYFDHPNIIRFRMVINLGHKIPVYSPDDSNLHRFDTYPRRILIMEYSDQGALEQFQIKDKFNDQGVFDDIVRGVCKGLKYMAEKCVTHDDLHAGNILIFSVIANDDRVSYMAKLSDFGQTTALVGRIPGHLNQVDANEFTDAVEESLIALAQFIQGTFALIKHKFKPLNVNLGDWFEVIQQLKDLTPLENIDLD